MNLRQQQASNVVVMRWLWSALWLSALFLVSEEAAADERVLRLDNGAAPQVLAVDALLASHTAVTLTIDDIEYGESHTYQGILLRDLLQQAGFAEGAQLLLVCTDGYSIPFDSSVLSDPQWQGLLALRDMAAPADKHFIDFQHGAELVNFAPFYLVWSQTQQAAAATTSNVQSVRELPWPYQLTEIRLLQPGDYQAAMPAATATPLVRAGFDLYFKHCIKCHSVNDAGGTLGPPLDAAHGLSALITKGDLAERIAKISDFYPRSKMPDFANTLTAGEVEMLAAYLYSLQTPD